MKRITIANIFSSIIANISCDVAHESLLFYNTAAFVPMIAKWNCEEELVNPPYRLLRKGCPKWQMVLCNDK